MEDYKEYFPKSKKVYFDHATKSLPPSVSLINLKPSRNYNHSFSEIARSNQKLYLSIKSKLSQITGLNKDNIALLPNRNIALNLIFHSLKLNGQNTVITSISEDTSIITPMIKLFDISFFEKSDSEYTDIDILIYSCIDNITGQIKSFDKKNKDQIKIIDASFNLLTYNVKKHKADIIIAELSIDALSPLPLCMIYIGEAYAKLQNPFPSDGNIQSYNKNKYIFHNDISSMELGLIDYNVLHAFEKALDFSLQIGMKNIFEHKSLISKYLQTKLSHISNLSVLIFPHYQNDILSHLSIQVSNAHDINLLLDEISNIEVRSGELCSQIGISHYGLDNLIRISWHLSTSKNDIDYLIDELIRIFEILN